MSELANQPIDFVDAAYARPVVERFNRMLLSQIHDETSVYDVDGVQVGVSNPHTYDELPDAPAFADTLGDDGVDTVVLGRTLPLGNGLQEGAVNQRLQSQFIADVTRRPVVTMSSPAFGTDYDIGRAGRATVAEGDFTPVSERLLGVLHKLSDGKLETMDGLGASQGAAILPNLGFVAMQRGQLEVSHLTVVSMPQVLKRNPVRLFNDFGQAGTGEMQERMLSTGVPQLLEANGLSLEKPEREPIGYLAMAAASSLRHPLTGAAMVRGMGKPDITWQRDIPEALEHGIDITLVSEGAGAIMPAVAAADRVKELKARYDDEAWSRLPGTLALYNFRDGDHTSADHVPTVAAIVNGHFRPAAPAG